MNRGFIEKVIDTTENPHKTYYIPHHCVKKNSITTLFMTAAVDSPVTNCLLINWTTLPQ